MGPRIESLLFQLDRAWEHPWESLTGVLRDLSREEASWQAPAYADEPTEPGEPPRGSIHWHIWHLADCKFWYIACLNALPDEAPPEDVLSPLEDYDRERERLGEIHAKQRAMIASLDDAQLELTLSKGAKVADFISGNIRHDTWHGGQIALIRRLYRTRPGRDAPAE